VLARMRCVGTALSIVRYGMSVVYRIAMRNVILVLSISTSSLSDDATR